MMLWLALYLPRLPLDVFSRGLSQPEPEAVVEAVGSVERVVACNEAAKTAGVQPGMKRSAAAALAGQLRITHRRPELEQQALAYLASWAQQFTPTITIASPASLLLEIGGCLSYFHGYDALVEMVRDGIAGQGYLARLGCAPTPLAAQWLAEVGRDAPVFDRDALTDAIGPLPVALLPLAAGKLQDLQLLGLSRISQVVALPRKGLARRFGTALPIVLEQALGTMPDPREHFVPPPTFSMRIELGWPVESNDALLFVARRLSIALSGYLLGLGLGVQQVTYRLEHANRAVTDLVVGYGTPTRQVNDLVAVAREKLTHFELPAPVEAISLEADRLHGLDGTPLDLFGDAAGEANAEVLRARLMARLGDDAVRQVHVVSDHRPECAWALGRSGKATTVGNNPRPALLMLVPTPLTVRNNRPWYVEPLTCRGLPERIETGWWDGRRVVRDYWTAVGESGRRYWVYQDRGSGDWFLHGLFD
ncbi:DNA polymerase Y family protein [Chitinivorax sp. PXF-14]|uniref:Y-family DNA polymerase n=1 Tax=Chitinivorax sp. PXF-14 TaxID=3230488 RepID=UPI003465F0D4